MTENYAETAIAKSKLLNGYSLDEANIILAERIFFEAFAISTNQDERSNALEKLQITMNLRIKRFPNRANIGW